MKKLILLIPIFLLSCNKTESVKMSASTADTVAQNPKLENDTANVAETAAGRQGMMREVDGNKIIRTADAQQIPFSIGEEFTEEDQQFILKIKNFKGQNITGEIMPEKPDMNIRFNQIKLPNGSFDGPFGRQINYAVKGGGELWLIIGKSNMASGDVKGNFSVNIR
ncbi:hypothetical protein [Chryseobacterium sp. HSC-36S06]|uniref:hypothetical protein n=1 Tax=Chryseobacterium sp. HSC-36S06 TaxID=2910970 RepID=UPI00209DBF12|nr:hypothetical protein [Chryseobacterium sp. HSC-36S06]MCP2036923.1 hypothetical protein [Chryseobacterium sp. HSC-36S06]